VQFLEVEEMITSLHVEPLRGVSKLWGENRAGKTDIPGWKMIFKTNQFIPKKIWKKWYTWTDIKSIDRRLLKHSFIETFVSYIASIKLYQNIFWSAIKSKAENWLTPFCCGKASLLPNQGHIQQSSSSIWKSNCISCLFSSYNSPYY